MYDLIDCFDVKNILLALFIYVLEGMKFSFNKPVLDTFKIKPKQSSQIKLFFFTWKQIKLKYNTQDAYSLWH